MTDATTAASGSATRRIDWALVAAALAVRWLIFLYGGLSHQVLTGRRLEYLDDWLTIWSNWDATSYLEIARGGYTRPVLLAYFPLYPWTVRGFALVTGRVDLAAFLVSGLASLAAVLLLQRLVLLDHPAETARRAGWFLLVYPTSFFLYIPYTESLFLALTLGCTLAARTGRWPLAGLLGALASLTRVNGVILLLVLAFEARREYRAGGRWNRAWLWMGAAPLGFAGYLWLNAALTGDPLAFQGVLRSQWQKSFGWPWLGVYAKLRAALAAQDIEWQALQFQELVFVAIAVVGTAASAFTLRASDTAWMAANTALMTSTGFVLSVPRYTLILFPLYVVFARLAAGLFWRAVITAWSLLFLAFFTMLFVRGHWVT